MSMEKQKKTKRKFRTSLSATIVFGIVFLILVMEAGAAAIGYVVFTDIVKEQYRDNANLTAALVSQFIDADQLDRYLVSGEKDEAYLETEANLQTIADSEDCDAVYVAKVDVEQKHRIYIYNIVSAASGFTPYEIGTEDTLPDVFLEGYRSMRQAGSEVRSYAYENASANGTYITSFFPLWNSEGDLVAVCAVVKTMVSLETARTTFLQQLLIWALFLALLAGSVSIYVMRRRISLPLRKIVAETDRFAAEQEKDDAGLTELLNLKNEIGELARATDKMESSILAETEQLLAVTAEKNRISTELDIATKIQMAVLPKIGQSFPGRREVDLHAFIQPAKEVGGDFYDCFYLDEDHLAMVIADVSDKGIPAALFMMIAKVLLKHALIDLQEPGKALEQVNQKLCETNETDMFVTVWVGILELSTGKLMAANAGHEYPVLGRRNGSYEIIRDKHGFVLGGMEGSRYQTYALNLEIGDRLFLYTDGLPEAVRDGNEPFGIENMLRALNEMGDADPRQIVNGMMEALGSFIGDHAQFDDTTILAMRYNGSRGNNPDRVLPEERPGKESMKEITVDAVQTNIDTVTEFVQEILEEENCSPKVSTQISVLIDELFGNIAAYAYGNEKGTVTVQAEVRNERELLLVFRDQGNPYNPLEKPDPDITLSAAERESGGLGIYLAKNLADEMTYRYEEGQNVLTVRKHLRD